MSALTGTVTQAVALTGTVTQAVALTGTVTQAVALTGTVDGFISASIESGMPIGLLLALTYTVS